MRLALFDGAAGETKQRGKKVGGHMQQRASGLELNPVSTQPSSSPPGELSGRPANTDSLST